MLDLGERIPSYECDSVLASSLSLSLGKPQESLSRRLAIQEHRRQKALHALARLRKEASEEIARLIAFLDQSDPYVMTELEDDDDREEVGDREPSLGSFDRMMNQEKSWRHSAGWEGYADLEHDNCDDEPQEDDEPDDSGIGDADGLLEQVGRQDWQPIFFI